MHASRNSLDSHQLAIQFVFIIAVGFHRIFFQTSGAVFISFVCLLLSRKKKFSCQLSGLGLSWKISSLGLIICLRLTVVIKKKENNDISLRFCRKHKFHKFLLYHVTPVSDHTATSKIRLRNECVVQIFFGEELMHATETVKDRWSVRARTSGILWASSAGQVVVRVRIDSECMLTCGHLRPGCRIQ